MTLRDYYDDKMDSIRSEVIRMGNLAMQMTQLATESVLSGNPEIAHKVIQADDEVDTLEHETIINTCVLMMQESPVASHLRALTSTLGVIGEFEKVADDAVKLAKRSSKLQGQFPGEMRLALVDMDKAARHIFASALKLYVDYSPALAEEIVQEDESIDKAYVVARNRVFELIKQDPQQTEHLVRTIEVFHALEHVADRSVVIAKRFKMHYESLEATSRAS